ncbi:PREDICTED: cysteine-rich motor neuron 1 protein-like [Ceratosolen solmsi marchali]|uniref:Cysteine-rich motor neuron 1 protein-like n=1 Tax=Ceratosolen solmsi marchali TaxID=326594 RepID=A0AAJ6VL97_9HYME|nr:PREDICTED: cysteine-rich motor neuron 1 protein-like [Ceratosolen solmsi marchali]
MAVAVRRAGTTLLLLFCLIGVEGAGCPEDSVTGDDGECKCVSPCPKHDCQPGQQPVQVNANVPEKPGSCCPLYECRNQAMLSWTAPEDVANKCVDSTGQVLENGERQQRLDDPCTSCICEAGVLNCQATMCRSCLRPLPRLPGECCPRCPALPAPPKHCRPLTNCDKRDCELGLETDERGCLVCRCRTQTQQNEPEDTEDDCPKLDCELRCEYGLTRDENGCSICRCKPHLGCPLDVVCQRKCPYGYRTNKRGCPTCRCLGSCLDERNLTHPEGSTWNAEPCRSCLCEPGGLVSCNETVCKVGCNDPLPPLPGRCCPLCPTPAAEESRGWGTVPVILIAVLTLISGLLMIHLVRGRFRSRLAPSEADFVGFPQQYYKCVPVYESHLPVLQHAEKIAPL